MDCIKKLKEHTKVFSGLSLSNRLAYLPILFLHLKKEGIRDKHLSQELLSNLISLIIEGININDPQSINIYLLNYINHCVGITLKSKDEKLNRSEKIESTGYEQVDEGIMKELEALDSNE